MLVNNVVALFWTSWVILRARRGGKAGKQRLLPVVSLSDLQLAAQPSAHAHSL